MKSKLCAFNEQNARTYIRTYTGNKSKKREQLLRKLNFTFFYINIYMYFNLQSE